MNTRERRRARMAPWRTPNETGKILEFDPSMHTYCFLIFQVITFEPFLYCIINYVIRNLYRRRSWFIVLNAFEKSRKTPGEVLPLSIESVILFVKSRIYTT